MAIANMVANFVGGGSFFDLIGEIIGIFKTRVAADSGTFEAESCLNSTITNLRSIDLV